MLSSQSRKSKQICFKKKISKTKISINFFLEQEQYEITIICESLQNSEMWQKSGL